MKQLPSWYLLYGGTSVDGRGEGKYIGRTTDVKIAQKHFKECLRDPYSVGSVTIITDTKMERAWSGTNWEDHD